MDTSVPSTAGSTHPASPAIHIYAPSTAARVIAIVFYAAAVIALSTAFLTGLLKGRASAGDSISLLLFVAVLGCLFAPLFRIRVVLTACQVEVRYLLRARTVPFTEITGCRHPGRGIYLFCRSQSRVWIPERAIKTDDFYWKWRSTIYDLDKAERRARKEAGKETSLDWFFDGDLEQHPAIGGPEPRT